ncbi:MAG: tetratricopeptide repeat protein [Elusimicrobiota bacterium]
MKRIALLLIILLVLPFAAQAKTVEELQQQNRMVAEYYRMAMDSFYRGDYTAAIRQWEEIMKVDPQQAQAQQLIEFARQKMVEKMKPLSAEVQNLIIEGKYAESFTKNQERLALDSANRKWKTLGGKLEKIVKIFPKLTENDKASLMAKKGINAYVDDKEDPRLALNACRYAWQLKPDNSRFDQLKELMEAEYAQLAQSERLISGTSIIEQKLQSVLSFIYDGKYDRAILECNDILELEPNNLMALKRAGSAYYASGNKKAAKEMWQRAGKVAPKDPEIKKFLKIK